VLQVRNVTEFRKSSYHTVMSSNSNGADANDIALSVIAYEDDT